ncbi:MAG: TRAP transporter small permease subunit [Rhodobacteraceae bacterium]|nr:TRAP transporter small permease subunit [Paracoccaceae bacterium]
MRAAFLSLADALHRLTRAVCIAALAVIVTGQLAVVILRYGFGIGFLELQDAVAYAFAALVVLGLPVALYDDAHVRVDVFREGQTPRTRARFDLAGLVLFLVPVFGLTLWHVWPDVTYSWSIREGSIETGGLPGFFLVKTCLPIACALMMLQGVARVLRPADG